MDRRRFLTLAAGSAAAAFPSDKTPVGIGFLGASYSHAAGKLEVVRSLADYRLVGICESDPQLREKYQRMGIALLSREELLRHAQVQVIAVESPVSDHAADGLAVIEARKHLHLEKVPSDTMAKFLQIVDLAQRKNLLLQVGYMWRYNPGIVKALEAARQGWLGRVYYVRGHIGNQLAARRRPEWAEFRGGIMFELGCHLIDPMVRLMGRPQRVTPTLHSDGPYQDHLSDNTIAVFEWPKALGAIQAATLEPGASRYRTFEVHGSNGRALVNPIEPPELTIDLEKEAGPYKGGSQKIELPKYRRYVDDLIDLAAAVRGEKKLPIPHDEDLMVEEAVLRSSEMF